MNKDRLIRSASAVALSAGLALGIDSNRHVQAQTTPTPEVTPDVYAVTDDENIRALQAPVDNVVLQAPRILGIAQLDIRFAPDPPRVAIIGNEQGVPYALAMNVGCVVDELVSQGELGEMQTFNAGGGLVGRNYLKLWPSDVRFAQAQVSKLAEEFSFRANGIEYRLPVVVFQDVRTSDKVLDCRSILAGDLPFEFNLNTLGRGLGNAFGELTRGIEEGLEQGRNN